MKSIIGGGAAFLLEKLCLKPQSKKYCRLLQARRSIGHKASESSLFGSLLQVSVDKNSSAYSMFMQLIFVSSVLDQGYHQTAYKAAPPKQVMVWSMLEWETSEKWCPFTLL